MPTAGTIGTAGGFSQLSYSFSSTPVGRMTYATLLARLKNTLRTSRPYEPEPSEDVNTYQITLPGIVIPEAIQWLHRRKVPSAKYRSDETNASRNKFWYFIINPEMAPEKDRTHYRDIHYRLDVIYTAGDSASNTVPADAHKFTDAEFPGYDRPDSLLYYVNNPAVCVQRYQRSKLCYLHAPSVVQYYAIEGYCRKHGLTNNHTMIDIAFHIKKNYDNKGLEKHIFDNDGGNSGKMLREILQPGSALKTVEDLDDCETVRRNLALYGPALVSNFMIHADFIENDAVRKFYGSFPSGSESKGRHAMVLVGYKIVGETTVFLLQNWWLKKQFVEMDWEYLRSCEPKLIWVVTDQASIPDGMPTKIGSWVETCDAEFLDGYELEE